MTKRKQNILKKLIRITAKLAIGLMICTVLQVAAVRFINPPGTVNMVYEWVRGRYFDKPYVSPTYLWRDLDQISGHLKQAVLASEDQRFLSHNGFDFQEIKIVIKEVMANKGFRGASTISMQTARSLFLPSSRNILRKMAEAWYTVLIELFWDKPRILEIYLNTVDWGTGIVGAQAGADHYFSKNADKLTRSQAALMTAILPSPHKWSVTEPSPYILKRKKWILKQMPAMPRL